MSATPVPITSYSIGTIQTPSTSTPGGLGPNPIGDGMDSACNTTHNGGVAASGETTAALEQSTTQLGKAALNELTGITRFLKAHTLFTVVLIIILVGLIFRKESK